MHSYVCITPTNAKHRMVLILVLMEDALVLSQNSVELPYKGVLILVLMEDALVHVYDSLGNFMRSLNPCFNGRCTRTENANLPISGLSLS